MTEKQIMLRITIAQRMIAELLEAGNAELDFTYFSRAMMPHQEAMDALQKAYSELNVVALRGETQTFNSPRTLPKLKTLVLELSK